MLVEEAPGRHARMPFLVAAFLERDRMPVVVDRLGIVQDRVAGLLQPIAEFQVLVPVHREVFVEAADVEQGLARRRRVAGQEKQPGHFLIVAAMQMAALVIGIVADLLIFFEGIHLYFQTDDRRMRPLPVQAQMFFEQVGRGQNIRIGEQNKFTGRFPDSRVAGAAAAPVFGGANMAEVGDRQFGEQLGGAVGRAGIAQQQFVLVGWQRLVRQQRQHTFQGFPAVERRDDDANHGVHNNSSTAAPMAA